MDCQEILTRVAQHEGGDRLPSGVQGHLEGCPSCREQAGRLLELDAFAREHLKAPAVTLPRLRRPLRVPALAASALLAAGAGLLIFQHTSSPTTPVPASLPAAPGIRDDTGGELESAPGTVAELRSRRLSLRAGACWVEARETLELEIPLKARIAAGSQVELTLLERKDALSWNWLRAAEADESPALRISVVAGEVELSDLPGSPCLRAGSRGRVVGGILKTDPLTEIHLAEIEAWRARSLEARARPVPDCKAAILVEGRFLEAPASPRGAVLTARLRHVTGHLVLRYPLPGGAGETTLGDLPVWRTRDWHRLVLKSGASGADIFLDGRRLLKVPPLPVREAGSPGAAALGVRGGSAEVADLSVGPLP